MSKCQAREWYGSFQSLEYRQDGFVIPVEGVGLIHGTTAS